MGRTQWLLVALVVLLAAFIGVYYFTNGGYKGSTTTNSPTPTTVGETTASPSAEEASPSAEEVTEAIVMISSSGFSPKSVKIKIGGKVLFVNGDSADHQVMSNPHPTHTGYAKLNVGVIKPNDMQTAEFDTAGTFGYHDHLNPSLTGEVVVE